jgi:hypothetical protein
MFTRSVTIIDEQPPALGSDTPTLAGMIHLRIPNPAPLGKKYKISYRWEPWSVVVALRAARDAGTILSGLRIGNCIIAAPDGVPDPTHAQYGKEADPADLAGGPMDIWNGEVTVYVSPGLV